MRSNVCSIDSSETFKFVQGHQIPGVDHWQEFSLTLIGRSCCRFTAVIKVVGRAVTEVATSVVSSLGHSLCVRPSDTFAVSIRRAT
jgi:hypothetical protein